MKSFLILVCLYSLIWGIQSTDPTVFTKVGTITGLWDEKGYSKFLGVPYGKVDNVFGPAVPYPVFEDVFNAYDDSKICVQARLGVPFGTIDCLNMNIYVPNSASTEVLLPVMVWIHGGGFTFGSALEARNPYVLIRHDVIVVAINYRLGVFGFMCLDIPQLPGNTGLKDQVLALRWIKENIEAFGGDPNQITVAGESAGGMATNLHLLSHYEKLFDRAIIQSGPANSYWMMVESDKTIPFRVAEELSFYTTDILEALNFLSQVNPQTVAVAAHKLALSNANNDDDLVTLPCVEKYFEGVEYFMLEHPMNIKSDKVDTTAVIMGYNNVEFASQFANMNPEFFESYDFRQHFSMGFNMTNNLDKPVETVHHFYIGDHDLSQNDRWNLIDFGSDFIFNHPTQRMAEKLLEEGAESVYYYVFSYNGSLEMGGFWNKTWVGATHAEELLYLFASTVDEFTSPEDLLTIDKFTKLWTNFVKYGDPTPYTSELLPVKWLPTTKATQIYFDINSELSLQNSPFNERMAFWDLFYTQYGHLQKWYK